LDHFQGKFFCFHGYNRNNKQRLLRLFLQTAASIVKNPGTSECQNKNGQGTNGKPAKTGFIPVIPYYPGIFGRIQRHQTDFLGRRCGDRGSKNQNIR